MKAEIRKDGFIWIIAETATEAFALNHMAPGLAPKCAECGNADQKVVVDCSLLAEDETDQELP